MAAQLKLIGGTESSVMRASLPQTASRTTSAAMWIDDMFGMSGANNQTKINQQWKEIAEYVSNAERIRSISRTMANFNSSVAHWKEDTKFTSSLTEMLLHPAYQRIIGLGPDVVPFVLRELADNGGHWFWALEALSGENPVPSEHQGRPRLMKEAWLAWGKANHLI
ncbi:MAG: hypothetical protein JJD98_10385 [Polaromonas sp.]|nr:hypothetical protein [Polaromonas sp.]